MIVDVGLVMLVRLMVDGRIDYGRMFCQLQHARRSERSADNIFFLLYNTNNLAKLIGNSS